MKQRFNFILGAVIPLFFFATIVKGQESNKDDSLSFYLNSIKSSADSNNIVKAFEWLYISKDAVLLKGDVMNKIKQLKSKLNERDYYDLAKSYIIILGYKNTAAFNEKAIEAGQQWLAENEKSKSKYGHFVYLDILRELRKPFRNSGKHSEAVEYFAAAEKKYLAVNDSDAVSIANNVLSGSYARLGLIEKAKYYQLKSISYLNNSQKDFDINPMAILFGLPGKVNRYAVLGSYYITEKKPAIAESFLNEAITLYHQLDSPMQMQDAPYIFLQMARCKTLQKNANSSSYYDTALNYMAIYKAPPVEYAHYYQEKAADFISKNLLDSALNNINRAIQLKDSFELGIVSYYGELLTSYYKASILIKKGNAKDAITLLQSEIKELNVINNSTLSIDELSLLAEAYSTSGNALEGYKTLRKAFLLKEQLVSEQNDARSLNFETEMKMKENENTIGILDAQNKANQKTKYYLFGIVGLLALFLLGLAFFYANKRKTNRQLALKNESLAVAILRLQATQSQLIQSEKMASLGELTAGIAHEIQNPLNFVNNFSEVSVELIEELKSEKAKPKSERDDLVEEELLNDIAQNLQKINHHGKRADGIVKGMLQHSRSSSGQKELTDINTLADEYLRLSYHGLRAKDKSFNVTLKTDFDKSIGNINIIPQDIGRVILNLITNAFYVVDEKKKQGMPGYDPTVSVSTKKVADKVLISVTDNGNGIPDAIKDKIFQPFFTTKPTGQGTGLGLSLSYDIMKAHGGELKVETIEGEGTIFIMTVPG